MSWALPQGPSYRAGELREAIEMEPHRKAYLLFEGVHKTGPIMLWDCGTWKQHPGFEDVESRLGEGILRFTLYGDRLKGDWMLARTNRNAPRPVWTLSKLADSFAKTGTSQCLLQAQSNSIKSGRTMEEIVRDWTTPKNKHTRQTKLFD